MYNQWTGRHVSLPYYEISFYTVVDLGIFEKHPVWAHSLLFGKWALAVGKCVEVGKREG